MHYIRLVGDDPEQLKKVATELKPTFELLPGVDSFLSEDIEEEGPSEVALLVDREKASSFGIHPETSCRDYWNSGSRGIVAKIQS